EAAPATRGDVVGGGAAGLAGLAGAGPLLVDGAGRDLLGRLGALTALLQALLDVLVLALALGVPGSLRHGGHLLTCGHLPVPRPVAGSHAVAGQHHRRGVAPAGAPDAGAGERGRTGE